MSSKKALIGNVFSGNGSTVKLHCDGAILISEKGQIENILNFQDRQTFNFSSYELKDYSGSFILPGFIDSHIHLPQMDMIGAYSGELLDWLKNHTFKEETLFLNSEIYTQASRAFISKLLRNGTTGAAIYASSKKEPTDFLLGELKKSGMWAVAGKISMNHGANQELLSSLEEDLADQKKLIEKHHSPQSRIRYALTPRFALSCSFEQMKALGDLKKSEPSLYVQTHFSENKGEISATMQAFADYDNYLDIYHKAGLLSERTILGHGIHQTKQEVQVLKETGTWLAHCPTSNQFLGSGLMPVSQLKEDGVGICLATDVGAGTSFSMWATMREALNTSKLLCSPITPLDAFELATQKGAEALGISSKTGSIEKGKDADICIYTVDNQRKINEAVANLRKQANDQSRESLNELMSLLCHRLGEENTVAVYLEGEEKGL